MADFKAGLDGASFLKADNFGDTSPDQFILNKDPENDSFQAKEMSAFVQGIYKMLKKSPEVRHFGMLLYAGHGMIRDGVQCFLMN